MSYISEKVAYLDGLAEGLSIDESKEGKLLRSIIDVLGSIAEQLEEQDEALDDLNDCVEDLYETMDGDNKEHDGDEDQEFFEIVCPSCGETIYFDEDMLDSEDGLICPCCNEPIEINLVNGNEIEIGGPEDEAKWRVMYART